MSTATMPKVEDKLACDVCGKLVTTHTGGRASHMRTHEVKVESAPKTATISAGTSKLNDEDKAILARAMAAEESFRKAPAVFLSEDTADGNMALVKLYAPECIDKFDGNGKLVRKAERHAFFSSRANLAKWAHKGYIPVVGDNGEFVANEGGDILTACDRDNFEAREKRAQNESRKIVRKVEKNLDKTKMDNVDAGSNSDLREVSLKVETEEIEI